ncbi:uncharacterized protein LOC129600070 [Paramacrobiotus metropolitanus]|uniref:uncharacterized protein LOC129600070 n=1 Tax=Paramacrobiotus metropolitanus TaxID=2943436 RepID=UPI002445B1B8|nr:uncharacterized protein LOC129600070 [Paramacrobiotus metropolitanus]
MRFHFLICILLAVPSSLQGAVLNTDPRFNNWPRLSTTDTVTRIPVYIETGRYTGAEVRNIREGISLINADLNGCVNFFEFTTPGTPPGDFLWITANLNNGTRPFICMAIGAHAVAQNRLGQKLILVSGAPGGCVGNTREVVKFLANTLGLLNEFQRLDRPITVIPANVDISLQGFNIYSPFQSTLTNVIASPFDYYSVTLYAPAKFQSTTGTGLPVYTNPVDAPTNQNFFIPRLSRLDCLALVARYQCNAAVTTCPDPYATG